MAPLVGVRIREGGGPQQRLPHRRHEPSVDTVAGHVVAVDRVVDDGDAEAGLADMHVAVGARLVAGRVPRGVGVGGPADVPERRLVGGVGGVHVEGECELQQPVPLVPVDVGLDAQRAAGVVEREPLGERAGAEGPLDHHRPAVDADGAVRQVRGGQVHGPVQLPGVPLGGRVDEHLEEVAPAALGDQLRVALTDDDGERAGDQRLEPLGGDGVGLLRLAVHPRDGAAGQDVVELQQQDLLPQCVEFVVRIGGAAEHRGLGPPQLGFDEQRLVAPVAALGARLRREHTPVELEVHLAGPDRAVCVRLVCLGEERLRRVELDAGGALEVGLEPSQCHHLAGGSAAAVAVAERHQRRPRSGVVGEVLDAAGQLGGVHRPVVGVVGREVREHARPVDALPVEAVVGHGVDVVPAHLLREEPADPGAAQQLPQRSRVVSTRRSRIPPRR